MKRTPSAWSAARPGPGRRVGLKEEIDLQMGTLSKSLGVSGGYICGSRNLIDWLINRARSFIFSTAPPPALARSRDRPRFDSWLRKRASGASSSGRRIVRCASSSRRAATAFGKPTAAIIPWMVGRRAAAHSISRGLQQEDFLFRRSAIQRWPRSCAAPDNGQRRHSEAQIESLGRS